MNFHVRADESMTPKPGKIIPCIRKPTWLQRKVAAWLDRRGWVCLEPVGLHIPRSFPNYILGIDPSFGPDYSSRETGTEVSVHAEEANRASQYKQCEDCRRFGQLGEVRAVPDGNGGFTLQCAECTADEEQLVKDWEAHKAAGGKLFDFRSKSPNPIRSWMKESDDA